MASRAVVPEQPRGITLCSYVLNDFDICTFFFTMRCKNLKRGLFFDFSIFGS